MKWPRNKMNALAMTMACAFCAVVMWFLVDLARGVEVIKHLKVADCGHEDVTFTTTLPPGHGYNLILAIPRAGHLSPTLCTHIAISDLNNTISDFAVASGDAEECNWLQSEPNLQGYILSWQHRFRLSEEIHGRHTYKFTIHFSEAPPQDSSLWLCWLQNRKD